MVTLLSVTFSQGKASERIMPYGIQKSCLCLLLSVVEAKVKSTTDAFIDLVKQNTNSFSLAGLPVVVYTLDVITQKGNTRAAYEGILVLGRAH